MNVYDREMTQLNNSLIDNQNLLNEQKKIAITNNINKLKKQYNELNIVKKQSKKLSQFKKQINYGRKSLKPSEKEETYYRQKSITLQP
ncbi:MAG: hypothetical protein ACL7BU_10840 [Candidatus Phlomobacter fragariae]